MKKYLILIILSIQFWTLNADNYYCKRIGIENGLSQSSVTSIVYDDNGALWVGTRFGLNEYRNGNMRTFLDDDSGRIKGNYVNFLFCDSRKNLWASTDKGLFKYDLAKDSFAMFDENPAFCAAESGDSIFFGGHNGISIWSHSEEKLSASRSEVYKDYALIDFYDGALLSVDRKEGIALEYADSSVTLSVPEIQDNLVMDAARSGNILYLGVINLGLVEFDLDTRSIIRIIRHGEEGMPSDLILTIMVNGSYVWMGFDGAGLRILDTETGKIHAIQDLHHLPFENQIPSSVTSLYKDPIGNIWIGSVRSGIVGLKVSPIKLIPMEGSIIISLFRSNDGYLYIGTDGNGIKRYNPANSSIESFPGQEGIKALSIADYDSRRLLLSIYNRGFCLMDRKSGEMTPFILIDEKTNAAECLNSNAPKIYELDESSLMLTAVNTYRYDKLSGKFESFEDETGEFAKELVVLGKDENNSLYAYSYYGLFRINLANHTVSMLYKAEIETGSINTAEMHNGVIQFGTNYGLFSYDIRTGVEDKVHSELFNRVSKLHYGTGGNLWIAADNSLFLYRNGVFEMVGENRGVPANEFMASVTEKDGSIIFGGTNGLIEIGDNYSYNIEKDKQIVLHDISVRGSRAEIPKGPLNLKFNYSSLSLTVNLAGADPFEKVRFRYSVEGGSGFVSESFDDHLELPGLKQGTYDIYASYLMANGQWSHKESVLRLRVAPPWYKSVPMIIVYVILCLSILILAVEKLSQRKIAKIEADLRLKDKAFTSSLLKYIDENIANADLNVADIALNMAMSRASLYNKVNSSFNKGVAALIEERRMVRAEELLTTTSLSVLDISEKCGYATPRYFSTRFKQLHDGTTPLKYRKTAVQVEK